MDDEALEAAFRRATEPPRGRAACPDATALSRLAAGELDEDSHRRVRDHAFSCRACAAELRIAMSLRSLTADGEASASTSAPKVPASRAWGWPLAAGVTLAAGLGAATFVATRPSAPSPPAPLSSGPRESGEIPLRSLVDESQPLPRGAIVLRWSSAGDDVAYDVHVANESLEVLYESSSLEATEHRVPPEAVALIAPGGRLLWRLEAVHPDGTRAASPTFFVTLE